MEDDNQIGEEELNEDMILEEFEDSIRTHINNMKDDRFKRNSF